MEPDRSAILKALEQVIDPELRRPVTELDMVRDVESVDGVVSLTIVLTVAGCPLRHSFEEQIDRALAGVPGRDRGRALLRGDDARGAADADDEAARRRARAATR